MGEWQDIPCISQVLEPLLDRREHTHFVVEPGQLVGCCPVQGMQIMKQQVMDRGDDKGWLLLSGCAILSLFGCVQEAPRSAMQTNVLDFAFQLATKRARLTRHRQASYTAGCLCGGVEDGKGTVLSAVRGEKR